MLEDLFADRNYGEKKNIELVIRFLILKITI